MKEERKIMGEVVGMTEGARRATGGKPTTGGQGGPLGPKQRWSVSRKKEVVLRMLRGESVEVLSRELSVEIYRLEKWRKKALAALSSGLKERGGDFVQAELDAAMKRIGELTMEIELLRERINKQGPFGRRRSRR